MYLGILPCIKAAVSSAMYFFGCLFYMFLTRVYLISFPYADLGGCIIIAAKTVKVIFITRPSA